MDKEIVLHIHSEIWLSYKKEYIWVSSMRWMNLEPIIQSEISQREKQISYTNAYIWNLEKWYWWSYLQGSKGDTDIKNRLLDTVGEEDGDMIWERSIDTYTLPYVKQMTSVSSMHEAAHPKPVLSDNLEG